MAIAVLENPVLFGMRLGAELDQLRQGAMTQAITQSLREALDLHTWRFGMIANLLAAYHRAQSPQERAAYAALLESLAEAAQEPKGVKMVVPGVGVHIGYLPMTRVGQVLGMGVARNQPQPQGQQGGSTQQNQPQPAGQQATAPETAAATQPPEMRKLTKKELQAILDEVMPIVNPWYGLVRNQMQPTAQQTAISEQQTEGAAQPIQQQPVEKQDTEQLIPEEQLSAAPVQYTETAVPPVAQQQVSQQTQGTLGGILQQQPDQQQLTTPAQPSQQDPEEYAYTEQAMQFPDWSRMVREAQDRLLPIVIPGYSLLVKNNPQWRQALSEFLQLDLEKMSQFQRRRP